MFWIIREYPKEFIRGGVFPLLFCTAFTATIVFSSIKSDGGFRRGEGLESSILIIIFLVFLAQFLGPVVCGSDIPIQPWDPNLGWDADKSIKNVQNISRNQCIKSLNYVSNYIAVFGGLIASLYFIFTRNKFISGSRAFRILRLLFGASYSILAVLILLLFFLAKSIGRT